MASAITHTLLSQKENLPSFSFGGTRIESSFRRTLDQALQGDFCNQREDRLRREELEALAGLSEGLSRIADPGERAALEPTLRHLLARVL